MIHSPTSVLAGVINLYTRHREYLTLNQFLDNYKMFVATYGVLEVLASLLPCKVNEPLFFADVTSQFPSVVLVPALHNMALYSRKPCGITRENHVGLIFLVLELKKCNRLM